MSSRPTVLVVEDDSDLADLYATWLEERYRVAFAADAAEALEVLSDSIDVVLLDRRLPDRTGDDLLATIRERGYDCRVAMVTAVDPGLDVVELDFDDYVTKPVTREQLTRVVETLYVRSRLGDETQRQLEALSKKMEQLEAELSIEELEETPEYERLETDLKALSEMLLDGLEEEEPRRR